MSEEEEVLANGEERIVEFEKEVEVFAESKKEQIGDFKLKEYNQWQLIKLAIDWLKKFKLVTMSNKEFAENYYEMKLFLINVSSQFNGYKEISFFISDNVYHIWKNNFIAAISIEPLSPINIDKPVEEGKYFSILEPDQFGSKIQEVDLFEFNQIKKAILFNVREIKELENSKSIKIAKIVSISLLCLIIGIFVGFIFTKSKQRKNPSNFSFPNKIELELLPEIKEPEVKEMLDYSNNLEQE